MLLLQLREGPTVVSKIRAAQKLADEDDDEVLPGDGQDRYVEVLRSSYKGVFNNLNDTNIRPGAVIASPSRQNPNYYYHWVRDAGLTMMELVQMYRLPLRVDRKVYLEQRIWNWIRFENQNQYIASTHSNLGEPIFTVTGEIYPHPWGRPQGDGPAIRALAMIEFAQELIEQGRIQDAAQLYRAEYPAQTPIKRDLEYVALHWRDASYDLWEEVKGDHFFTRMAQRASLLRGAQLALKSNDPRAAAFYQEQATLLEQALLSHRAQLKGHLVPTLNQTEGWRHKTSELDISTVLAVLYFSMGDGFFDINDQWVFATVQKLEDAFQNLYPINRDTQRAPAIGRYPEDVYNGNGFGEGSPWFLATFAFAEYYCRLAKITVQSNEPVNPYRKAISFLDRGIFHADPGNRMPEQFNRHNGYTQGARDLTWSYTSYIRSFRNCSSDLSALDFGEIDQIQETNR
jgi:glucoamylase